MLDALHILVMDEEQTECWTCVSDAIDEVIRFAPGARQTLFIFTTLWPDAIAAISDVYSSSQYVLKSIR